MRYGFRANRRNKMDDFQQRSIEQSMQSISDRQEAIRHAKHGYIGMLLGILTGGIVSWLFFGVHGDVNAEKTIPVIRRPLIAAKVQPNDPGGMEIDNQDREIYHIVDNIPTKTEEVKIIPAPEVPQIIVENTIATPENMENLVESISEEGSLEQAEITLEKNPKEETKLASQELAPIKTNSNEKITIPEKISDIAVKLQKTINTEPQKTDSSLTETTVNPEQSPQKVENQIENQAPMTKGAKGTWYAQIIASSSRKAVENLWNQLSAKHDLLKSYSHEVEEIKAANGNTLYRLKVCAFKTRSEAESLNNKLKQNQISSIIKQN
jgi:cell division protein FtsN